MTHSTAIRLPRSRQVFVRTGARAQAKLGVRALFLFVAIHAPLALGMKLVPFLSTVHALVSLVVALMLVVRRYPMGRVVAGCAYLVGSEALWRMTNASVFWEYGKYSLLLVVITAMSLRRLWATSYLPVLYLALLVPGALLTIVFAGMSFGNLRQVLSFDLSGPVAYSACSLFLFRRNLSREDVLRCLAVMLAPIVGVATLTLFGVRMTEIQFGSSASLDASGGFGPNQVAAALALGVVGCFLFLTNRTGGLVSKVTLTGLIVWFEIQAALTFSRSGLYYSVAAILAGAAFLVADVRRFVLVLALGLALLGLAKFVITPRLDAFTGGALGARFARTDLTGRGDLMQGDLLVFLKHPLLGVGVGLARESRKEVTGKSAKSHTEFTRLLSEHGLLGAAALVVMLVMSARSVLLQSPGWPRAFSASLLTFAFIFMTGSGMRMAIPSFLLAFAGVRIGLPQLRRARESAVSAQKALKSRRSGYPTEDSKS